MTPGRALPGPIIDLIRDGVPPVDLKASGGKAVYRALVRTAASAVQRGWDCWEWSELVLEPTSTLGRQASVRGHKPRTAAAVAKLLDGAWDRASTWISEQPAAHTRSEVRTAALAASHAALLVAADATVPLLDSDRRVLAYAGQQAAARGMDRLALPRRTVAEATGLGERSVRAAFDRLEREGLLVLAVRGRSAAPGAKRAAKASLYRLADAEAATAYLYRETRSMGPPVQVYGTPSPDWHGTSPQVYGTPGELPKNVTLLRRAAS